MRDTGFFVKEKDWDRIAEPFKDTGEPKLIKLNIFQFF